MASQHARIALDWADGTYAFRLGLGEIAELEDKAGAGVFQIAQSAHPDTRTIRSSTISDVLRLGLIGGGMDAAGALKLVRRYCDERPMIESLMVAYAVLMAGIARVHGEQAAPAGEPDAAETGEPTSPPSTRPAR